VLAERGDFRGNRVFHTPREAVVVAQDQETEEKLLVAREHESGLAKRVAGSCGYVRVAAADGTVVAVSIVRMPSVLPPRCCLPTAEVVRVRHVRRCVRVHVWVRPGRALGTHRRPRRVALSPGTHALLKFPMLGRVVAAQHVRSDR